MFSPAAISLDFPLFLSAFFVHVALSPSPTLFLAVQDRFWSLWTSAFWNSLFIALEQTILCLKQQPFIISDESMGGPAGHGWACSCTDHQLVGHPGVAGPE